MTAYIEELEMTQVINNPKFFPGQPYFEVRSCSSFEHIELCPCPFYLFIYLRVLSKRNSPDTTRAKIAATYPRALGNQQNRSFGGRFLEPYFRVCGEGSLMARGV